MIGRIDLPDGQYLAFAEHGAGDDVLLLLHGGGLDHRMWEPQLAAFPGWRVIAPDARAHGASSTPDSPYRLVDDVAAMLDQLGVDRCVVGGVSMGGGTAVDLAVEYPQRVRGLVVSGTGTSAPDFGDPWVLDILASWRRAEEQRDPQAWVAGFARFVHGPHRRPDQVDPQVRAACDEMVWSTLKTHVLPVAAGGGTPVAPTPIDDVNARRASLAVPVLAIVGDLDADDHVRLARELVALVDDAREVIVPGTAHYPNLERPDEFNAAVAVFLRTLPR